MKQGGNNSSQGFTIVEVLIVLAASSLLFVIAASFVNGQQNRAEFVEAVQQTQSEIQQGIDNVINGYYPNNNYINCTVSMATGYPTATSTYPNPGTAMGENPVCIFVGSVFWFNNQPSYNVYPVYGDRYNTASPVYHDYALSLEDSNARIMDLPGDYNTEILNYGLTIDNVKYVDSSGNSHSIGAIAIASSFHGYSISAITDGKNVVELYALSGVSFPSPPVIPTYKNAFISAASGGTPTVNAVSTNEVYICFDSGLSNQLGILTITANINNGSNPVVTMAVVDGPPSGNPDCN